MTVARRFVRWAPCRSHPDGRVPVRVTDMTAEDAWWWDTRVQTHLVTQASRADRYWSWSVLLPACHLVQLAQRRFCRPLVVWARADNRRFVRVAMALLIETYPHLDVRDAAPASFTWFIAAADVAWMRDRFALSHRPALGRVLIDLSVVLSANAGQGGRMGLHAATRGGRPLLSLYRACGLTALPRAAKLPPQVRRRNDGRFFYADPQVAERLMQRLDPDRV